MFNCVKEICVYVLKRHEDGLLDETQAHWKQKKNLWN